MNASVVGGSGNQTRLAMAVDSSSEPPSDKHSTKSQGAARTDDVGNCDGDDCMLFLCQNCCPEKQNLICLSHTVGKIRSFEFSTKLRVNVHKNGDTGSDSGVNSVQSNVHFAHVGAPRHKLIKASLSPYLR